MNFFRPNRRLRRVSSSDKLSVGGYQDPREFSPHQDGCPSNPVNIACERGRPFLHLPVLGFAALRRRDALYNLVLENHVEPKLLPVRFMPACLAVTALFASAHVLAQS